MKIISIRIPDKLLKYVDELAKKNFSTRTGVLINFIAEHYNNNQKNGKENLPKSELQ